MIPNKMIGGLMLILMMMYWKKLNNKSERTECTKMKRSKRNEDKSNNAVESGSGSNKREEKNKSNNAMKRGFGSKNERKVVEKGSDNKKDKEERDAVEKGSSMKEDEKKEAVEKISSKIDNKKEERKKERVVERISNCASKMSAKTKKTVERSSSAKVKKVVEKGSYCLTSWMVPLCIVIIMMMCIPSAEATGDDDSSIKIKLQLFDGKQSSFSAWWLRFMAYAVFYKFDAAVKEEKEPAMLEDEEKSVASTDKATKAAVYRNKLAFAALTTALPDKLFNMLTKAQPEEWPSGLASLVVQQLKKKYQPKDDISEVEMEMRLNNIKMKDNDDPSTLLQQIAAIERDCSKATISDGKKQALLLMKAPNEYQQLLLTEQRIQKEACTADLMEEAMLRHYRQVVQPRINNKKHHEKEIAMIATTKHACWNCGEEDHQARDCPKPPDPVALAKRRQQFRGGKGRGKGRKCFLCGKEGHVREDCWCLPANADKRPSWWSAPPGVDVETANINADHEVEVLL